MKENNTAIPCIRALEFDCPGICTLLPDSSDYFWEAVYNLQIAPGDLRRELIAELGVEEAIILRELAEQKLRLSGQIYLCKSYLEGC